MSIDTGRIAQAIQHNLFAILTQKATDRQEQPFLSLPDDQPLTFGEFLLACARVTAWLQRCGIKAGDRMVVQAEKSPAAVVLYFGCVRSGVVFVPLNSAYTESEVEYFLSDAQPAMVVASPGYACATVPFSGARHSLEPSLERAPWNDCAPNDAILAVSPNDPAAILYTSGTTGRSKGAVLTHGNLSSNALVLHDAWRWEEGDVLLHALPIYHAHGLFVALHGALLNGSTVLFHEKFETGAVMDALPRATVFMGVPTFYTRLLDDPRFNAALCAKMRLFISGSAPLRESTFLEFEARTGHRILERYGMTEAVMVTSNLYDGPRKPGTVGRALPGISVRIALEGGRPAPQGEPGMLQIKGPNLFSGYWRNPEKTAEEHTADGYFLSGDVAVEDEDGFIRIVGREKDLIISGGFNIYPKEIELAIDALPGIAESAVIGVPHPDFGEGVVAVVVAQAGAATDTAAILHTLSLQLAAFKRPKQIIVVDELPRNAMGKVQKAQLRTTYGALFGAARNKQA